MLVNSFSRSIVRIDKCAVHNIYGDEWLCVNKGGKGILMSTADGCSPHPPDYLLMALGSCSADDVKIGLENKGHKVRKITAFVDGEIDMKPKRRFKDIKIRFEVDADGISKEEIREVATHVLTNVCPVANTIIGKPKVVTRATIRSSTK